MHTALQKHSLTNLVSEKDTRSLRKTERLYQSALVHRRRLFRGKFPKAGLSVKVKRLHAIDGKTQRGNGNKNQKGNHIVSAVDERGFCLGQKRVEEKTNEITAIPELIDSLNIKGTIITTDAMGTQTAIVKKIRKKRADYVLALKGNQGSLLEEVREYFSDGGLLKKCAYKKKVEKARGKIEKREYWQTEDISWLSQKKEWMGLKSIILTRNTITGADGKETVEERYFISSLPTEIEETARAVRGHWMIENYHWHLDVTFREDGNHTLNSVYTRLG